MSWVLLAALAFSPAGVVTLPGDPGWVAYVVATPEGLVISTADVIQSPPGQAPRLLLVTREGKLVRTQDLRALGCAHPTNPVWTGQELLVGDLKKGTLLVLDGTLEKKREVLLKGAHPHPYYPRFLAFARQVHKLFVTGCYPLRGYLDTGCLQIHEYAGSALEHVASSLESPPPQQEWGYMPVSEQYLAGVLPGDEVWAVEEAAGKGFRRLQGDRWQPLDFAAFAFKPAPYPKKGRDIASALGDAFLATGIFPLPQGRVAVAYASRTAQKSRVIVFSPHGKALVQRELPGRVAGESEGQLITAGHTSTWQLTFWRIE